MDLSNFILVTLFAFLISSFTSQAGVSGAFLILPFQISVLGFSSPAVSSTNFVYNIVAIPSGVYRYIREGRFLKPLALVIAFGTLPGIFIGALIRVTYLPDPKNFKLFVGVVLLYLGLRLLYTKKSERREVRVARIVKVSIREVVYEFSNRTYSFSVLKVFLIAFLIGIVGGAYGVGGGAMIAPILVSVFGLPIYTTAGATLFATFISSIAGVAYYSILGYSPNWIQGLSIGIGGFFGMYVGAGMQKFMPERVIRIGLSVLIIVLAIKYILQFFL
ncbi:putative permease [Archaeoglobus sulfaticallidus PM70-1]|uniref:Probable membrane transporter protein n=1 Tax=Archaeoglobus sulfaticallidus PM70-1 TaxID=387631 RepID=N0BM97_9EURY|nr:sulfite exporter TauE/SafE family protein [Archaeoglobus sulfaticallidus]AGK61746.1 putative permease [Archaeoglobus sulfaticallidus PM70-1]